MQKMFNKLRRFIFLSNYIRIIFYFIFLSVFTIQLNAQWLDAYIPDFKVNDDNLNSYQSNSQLGVDSAGNFVITWRDVRMYPGSQLPGFLYFQRYNKDGNALENNILVSQDTIGTTQINTLVDGRFILLWSRYFIANGGIQYYEFYFQRFNKNGEIISPKTKVLDSSYIPSNNAALGGFALSTDPTGKFIITWSRGHTFNTPRNVFFQRYDSSGVRLGLPDSVSVSGYRAEYPDIAVNNDGSFVITWQDGRFTAPDKNDIYLQKFDPNGIKIGGNIKVNDDIDPNTDQVAAQISTNGNGNIAIVWIDSRNGQTGMYYQIFDSSGGTVNVNRKADELTAFGYAGIPRISMRKDKNFYIAWLDVRYTGKDQFYGRRFDSIGNPIGNAYMIPANSPGSSVQIPNDIYLLNDRVYSTWHDNRNGGSINVDIYCNVRGFQNPDTILNINYIQTNITNEYNISHIYPNPFNTQTKIEFITRNNGVVNISIYNILGELITVLLNQNLNKGFHNISWDAINFPSGLYFIKLSYPVGKSEIKKIIYLK